MLKLDWLRRREPLAARRVNAITGRAVLCCPQ